MPITTCENCGRKTNTAVVKRARIGDSKEFKIVGCYGAYENGKWTKGCVYEEADLATRRCLQGMINRSGSHG